MNKNQIEGRLDQAKGKVMEIAGKVTHDTELQAEGRSNQLTGKVEANLGDAKEAVRDKAKELIDKI